MSTYRTGTHHGVTINREGDGARCGRPDHDCTRGHLVAVVVDGGMELAERIVRLLNAEEREARRKPTDCPRCGADVPLVPGGVCQPCATDMAREDA